MVTKSIIILLLLRQIDQAWSQNVGIDYLYANKNSFDWYDN